MCGIVGAVGPNPGQFDIEEALSWIRHRGPDDQGVERFPGAVLGHVRLSILDLSSAGHQPMYSDDRNLCLVHNGEIYNYLEIQDALAPQTFRSKTDTEVIIKAYERWGTECLDQFNGMFAFAVWDNAKQQLCAARDRMGIKPFYYTVWDGHFLFASEIKALLALGCPRQPNYHVIHDYLRHGYYEHTDETFFEGIHRLPPGHRLTYDRRDGLRLHRYWFLPDHLQDVRDEDLEKRFLDVLATVVNLECRSDVPVGILLSGGLDSSALLSLMKREYGGPLHAYSYAFDDERFDETPYMNQATRHYAMDCTVTKTSAAEFWRDFPATMWFQEEPTGSITITSFKKVFQSMDDDGVVAVLTGNGMDELMGGYKPHHIAYLVDLHNEHSPRFERECHGFARKYRLSAREVSELIEEFDLDRYYRLSTDGTVPVHPACVDEGFLEAFQRELVFDKPFRSHMRNLMYKDLAYVKLPRALRFQDKMSMRHSKELRPSFLNRLLVEFCYSLPPDCLVRDGEGKALFRDLMTRLLPPGFAAFPKRFKTNPQGEWLRGELQAHMWDVLHSKSFLDRPIYDHKKVGETYREFVEEGAENSFFVWQWLNLETWFRTFIDPVQLRPPVR
jgi:asparagine synthase (glutamine-hydrolysing)